MNDVTRPVIALCLAVALLALLVNAIARSDTGAKTVEYATVTSGEFGAGLRLLGFVQPKPAEAAGPPGWLATLPPAPAPVVAARTAAPPPPPPPAPRAWTDATYSQAVLAAVNNIRAGAELAPLAHDGRLAAAASKYAYHLLMTGTFSHNADGSTLNARVRAAGFDDNTFLGEVIAMSEGRPEPATLVRLWMESPPHNAQLLSATYVFGGAGCAFDATGVRCVLDMAR